MTKQKTLLLLLFFFILLLAVSCGKKDLLGTMTAEEAFHQALAKFQRGKYLDASEMLNLITLNFSGSSIVDSAQYYLAESHFRMKEYLIAASEYERLVYQYPSSHLTDDAKYKIGLSYFKISPKYQLDQEYTLKSIEQFQEFTEYHPNSQLVPEAMARIFEARSKLAKKSFKTGELYFKMRDYQSAVIYFDEVLDNYYDTDFAPQALLKKGQCYHKMKNPQEANKVFERLIQKYPNSPESNKAQDLIDEEVEKRQDQE